MPFIDNVQNSHFGSPLHLAKGCPFFILTNFVQQISNTLVHIPAASTWLLFQWKQLSEQIYVIQNKIKSTCLWVGKPRQPVMQQSPGWAWLTARAPECNKKHNGWLCSNTSAFLTQPDTHTIYTQLDKNSQQQHIWAPPDLKTNYHLSSSKLNKIQNSILHSKKKSIKCEASPLPLHLGIPIQPPDLSSNIPPGGNISLALNQNLLIRVSWHLCFII